MTSQAASGGPAGGASGEPQPGDPHPRARELAGLCSADGEPDGLRSGEEESDGLRSGEGESDGLRSAAREALEAFETHLAAERGRSVHTTRAYLGDVRALLEFAAARSVHDLAELDLRTLRA